MPNELISDPQWQGTSFTTIAVIDMVSTSRVVVLPFRKPVPQSIHEIPSHTI